MVKSETDVMDVQIFEKCLERISLNRHRPETFQDFLLEVKPLSTVVQWRPLVADYDCIVVQKLKNAQKPRINHERTELTMTIGYMEAIDFQESEYETSDESDETEYPSCLRYAQKSQLSKKDEVQPVDLKTARWLIALHNRCCVRKNVLPIFVLCDGDTDNIVFVASIPTKNGLRWVDASLESSENIPKSFPELKCFKAKHLLGFGNNTIVNSDAISTYDFSLSLSKNVKSKQKISFNFEWKNPTEVYEFPPKGCSCEVLVEGNIGASQCLISDLSREMQILKNLIYENALIEGDIALSELEHQILNMIPDLKWRELHPDAWYQDEASVSLFAIPPRQLDLTDYAWNIIKRFPQYSLTLINCLLLSKNLNEIKHMIFESNKTKLAKVIMDDKPKCALVEEIDSYKLLLDIGVDKLHRDFVSFFTANELASRELIEKSLHSDKTGCKMRFEKQQLVYESLDVILKCGIFLEMPRPLLAKFTSHILQHRNPKSYSFQCQIPSEMITPLLKSRLPTNWQVNFSSNDGLSTKISKHQFSTDCPIAWAGDASKQRHHLSSVEFSDQSMSRVN